MKKLILLFAFLPLSLFAQKLPTDALVFDVQSTLSTNYAYIDVQKAGGDAFWIVRTSEVFVIYSSDSYGTVVVERRNNSDFSSIDSMEITGNAMIGNIESDDEGNLYVVGRYMDSIRFDANNIYYTTATYTSFAMKLDTNMQIQWINPTIDAHFITVSPDGSKIFVRGGWNGFGGDVNVFQLDSMGNIAQTKLLTGIGYLSNIKTNNKGEVYFSGGCLSSPTQLDTIMVTSNFSYTMYYGKLDSNLKAEWLKLMDDITCEDISISIDTIGNVYFFGPLNKAIVLDTFQASPNLSMDFLLSSLTSWGNVNYVKSAPLNYRINPSYFRGLSTSGDNVAIFLEQDPNYNIHWGNNLYSQTGVKREQLILELDIKKDSVKHVNLFQTIETERIRNILYLSNGDLITTGKVYGANLITSTDTIPAADHLYVERWELPVLTSIDEHSNSSISVYPNPSKGLYHLNVPISGSIYDITGKEIKWFHNADQIDLSSNNAGIYLLKTKKGGNYKLIKY